jgi:hypothetical protein
MGRLLGEDKRRHGEANNDYDEYVDYPFQTQCHPKTPPFCVN